MPVLLLKKMRVAKGLSQFKLAQISSVSYGFISELENGKKSPTLETICKLAKALECRPEQLFSCNE